MMDCLSFYQGQRVRVNQRVTAPQEDHAAQGRIGTFVEYSRPNGFARVHLDPKPEWLDQSPDSWLIHPENLEAL